jgi:hypothetical protein
MSYNVLNFRIHKTRVRHRRSKMAGKGGERTFGRKIQNTAHVQMRLEFRGVINFRKEHVQKPSHPKSGVLIWRFWKVGPERQYSFLHLKVNFSLIFSVPSCVYPSDSLFFLVLEGENLEHPSTKEDHSQILRYLVSKKKSTKEVKIFIFEWRATLKVIFLVNLRMCSSWKHTPVCQNHVILSWIFEQDVLWPFLTVYWNIMRNEKNLRPACFTVLKTKNKRKVDF